MFAAWLLPSGSDGAHPDTQLMSASGGKPTFRRIPEAMPLLFPLRRVIQVAKWAALAFGCIIFVSSLFFVSRAPTLAHQARPSAQDLEAARQVWQQLEVGQGVAAADVRIDNRMVAGLAALTRDASGVNRIRARLSEGEVSAEASIPLPLGLWVNASASATGTHDTFPPVRIILGRVAFPSAAGRPLAKLGRLILRVRGADVPPIDEVVQGFSINENHLTAKIMIPSKGGLVDEIIASRSSRASPTLTKEILCRMAITQRAKPVRTLSELLRRTFAPGSAVDPVSYNRAAFVALSLAIVGDQAEPLVRDGAELRRQCGFPLEDVLLQGRADLAKHWTFSAALTSVLGPQAAGNLGEWKELKDGNPNGSGFSFVDLAADRAGVQTALMALAPVTARVTRANLREATDDYLLPKPVLAAPEGLSSASFVDRFGGLDHRQYREAVHHIDEVLASERPTLSN